ncbi:solute carrier family 35 member F3 isoform X1 [Culicoides brevitarsis]|uniref:solute carrier family 35 member F3 isoform X1 n=1 Tax=Culicoides brevitarsis TaxID=469753 RepID=UPI00307B75ED
MARDGEIPAIFNPRKVRAPSVVVTGDSPNGPFGGFTPTGLHPPPSGATTPSSQPPQSHHPPQVQHSDSVSSSQHDGPESLSGTTQIRCDTPTPLNQQMIQQTQPSRSRFKRCRDSCCSEFAQKMYFGVFVTILVTASWVGSAHSIKYLYLSKPQSNYMSLPPEATILVSVDTDDNDNTTKLIHTFSPTTASFAQLHTFNAPFFASWFFTNFTILFFPIYMLGRLAVKKCDGTGEVLDDIIRGYRDRGFTVGRFLNRCLSFCILWVIMTYILMLSLKSLLATDVLALFATNVASVYLLSWVILHEQFVGVRIVAVILCDTGIALLAYMDGITNSPSLRGVVLAALSAAGYAVFKVMFRKVMGDPPIGQIAFTFTVIGILNAAVLWPICVGLYFSDMEHMPWDPLPWIVLLIASILLLVFHILMQFSSAVTYNMFVTLGLITSVPVSAALDVVLYEANFYGMKLSGIILIAVGFFLVMFPDNWPDYITRLLRNIILLGHNASRPAFCSRRPASPITTTSTRQNQYSKA